MSGGHFDYQQYHINEIASEIEHLIERNKESHTYSDRTISEMKEAVELLQKSYVYAHRIDWLVSADDGEETFHTRLSEDLQKLKEV